MLVAGVVDADRRIDAPIAMPNDPSLVGAQVSLRAFPPQGGASLELGHAVSGAVVP